MHVLLEMVRRFPYIPLRKPAIGIMRVDNTSYVLWPLFPLHQAEHQTCMSASIRLEPSTAVGKPATIAADGTHSVCPSFDPAG